MAAKIRFAYEDLETVAEGTLDTRGRRGLADVPVHYSAVRLSVPIRPGESHPRPGRRSPLAHATVLGVDTSSAAASPGVLTVLTAADLGPHAPLPVNPVPGAEVVAVPPPPPAQGRVPVVGEA